ncbi:cytochrome c [Silicimonas sp. MF1-12-2]|uniref:cytochrome c n=1 Tax=Silicimonas sp. MF1-12-2 TaxID=3384793 RepID=UPI0039B63DB2
MFAGVCAVLAAFSVMANDVATDPQVRARIYVMKMLGEQAGKLDVVVASEASYDPGVARTVVAEIGELARQVPLLFKDEKTDHHSRASAEIWEYFEDFSRISIGLADMADEASTGLATLQDATDLSERVQSYCEACHDRFVTP